MAEKYTKKQMADGYEVVDSGEMRRNRGMERYEKMFSMTAEERSPGGFLSRPGIVAEFYKENDDEF